MSRWVHVIYCDDIRHEVGGKFSYIGVYNNKLLLDSIPVHLPKLCLHMRVSTPADCPFQELAIKVCMDEEVLTETTVTAGQLNAYKVKHADKSDQTFARYEVVGILTFAPFAIERTAKLRVIATTELGELRSNSLVIAMREDTTPVVAAPRKPRKTPKKKASK